MAYESSGEYIKHHLTNLVFGQHPDGSWGIAHGVNEIKEMGFWSINVDSMLFSIGLGCFFLWIFRRAAKKASTDAPTGLQNFIETILKLTGPVPPGCGLERERGKRSLRSRAAV